MSRARFLSKVKNVIKTLLNTKESPREMVERNDLYKVALASSFRNVRSPAFRSHSKEALNLIYDSVSESLEKDIQLYDMPIRTCRLYVQSLLKPQVQKILEVCRDVDKAFPDMAEERTDDVIKFCRCYLEEDRENIRNMMSYLESNDCHNKQLDYLKLKLLACNVLISFYEWGPYISIEQISLDGGDPFGYIINKNDDINETIRYYQLLNLAKATLTRKKLGFSTLALKSTIPRAGRGIYVDGFAPAGSIVSFFPGEVWPKEHLTSLIARKVFEIDPKEQLSMRYDDFLIDSRKAPYTVLNNERSNAFAIAHIANHPAPGSYPNCSSVHIDFSEDMGLKKNNIDTYVPNTYAKYPSLFGQQAVDLEKVEMHGMALITARDVENEELFFNYRLSGDKSTYPEWYTVVDQEEVHGRWHE